MKLLSRFRQKDSKGKKANASPGPAKETEGKQESEATPLNQLESESAPPNKSKGESTPVKKQDKADAPLKAGAAAANALKSDSKRTVDAKPTSAKGGTASPPAGAGTPKGGDAPSKAKAAAGNVSPKGGDAPPKAKPVAGNVSPKAKAKASAGMPPSFFGGPPDRTGKANSRPESPSLGNASSKFDSSSKPGNTTSRAGSPNKVGNDTSIPGSPASPKKASKSPLRSLRMLSPFSNKKGKKDASGKQDPPGSPRGKADPPDSPRTKASPKAKQKKDDSHVHEYSSETMRCFHCGSPKRYGVPADFAEEAADRNTEAARIEPGSEAEKEFISLTHVTTNSGVSMPRLICSTFYKRPETQEVVERAIKAGFRGVDSACQANQYDETAVGIALASLVGTVVQREDLFVQTKIHTGYAADLLPHQSVKRQIQNAIDTSLSNLSVAYVDSILLHGTYRSHSDTMEAWRAMEAAMHEGKAQQLGISNVKSLEQVQLVYEDASVKPAVVQQRFFQSTSFEFEMHNWCVERGIWFQSFWQFNVPGSKVDIGRRVVAPPAMMALGEAILCFQ